MKITSNNIINNYKNQTDVFKSANINNKNKRISKSFDEIIIQSTANAIPEDKFIKDLTSKISKDVRQQTSSYKLDELKAQIETGTYQIGLDEVANKILLN